MFLISSDSLSIYFSEHKHRVSYNPIILPVHFSKTAAPCAIVRVTRVRLFHYIYVSVYMYIVELCMYIHIYIYKACPSKSGTVSVVSWTNGTLVSTNKVIMCRQYVLYRYCHLCTTLQFIIYSCI
jgi:hypothetical protein